MFRTFGTLAVILALAAGSASAQPASAGGPGTGQQQKRLVRVREDAMAKLNLTDQQKESMQKLRIDMQKKNTPLMSQIKLARLEIQQLMMAENPDRAKIEAQMKEISSLELKIKLNGLDHAFAVRNVLTPEQRKIWKEERGNMFMGGMRERVRQFFRQGPTLGEAEFDAPVDAPMEIEEEVEIN